MYINPLLKVTIACVRTIFLQKIELRQVHLCVLTIDKMI